jgi:hypothetical protein
MAFELTDEGKKYLLTNGINNANVRLGLYKNNYTIIAGSVFANITACDFTGYAAATPVWGAASIDGGDHATQTATSIVFTQGTPGTTNSVYGYYLFDVVTSKLIGGDQLPGAPFVTASSGDTVTITPQQLVTQGT